MANSSNCAAFASMRMISSTRAEYIALHFHRADYPTELIQSSFERAFLEDRNELLKSKPEKANTKNDNLYLITTHHPTFREVNNIVSRNLDLLDRSSSKRPIIQANIVRRFR